MTILVLFLNGFNTSNSCLVSWVGFGPHLLGDVFHGVCDIVDSVVVFTEFECVLQTQLMLLGARAETG